METFRRSQKLSTIHLPVLDHLVDLDAGDEMTKSVRSTARLSSLTPSCRTSIVRCEEVDSGFSVCLDLYYALELSVTTIEGNLFT